MKVNSIVKNYLKHRIAGYISKDQHSDDLAKFLRLDLGENLLVKNNFLNNLHTLSEDTFIHYSDPSNSKIKQIIAEVYGVSSKNIMIANSSNEIIDLLPRMIIDRNSKVITISPSFFRFDQSSLKTGASLIRISLKHEDRYVPNAKIIQKICETSRQYQAGIIWLSSPNNPTGEVYQLEDIEQITKLSPGLVIVDEAYHEFYDLENKYSAINLINKYSNLIVLRTLSKAYGLAGLRLGYALGYPETISIIEKYQDNLLMTSALIVKIAAMAFNNRDHLKTSIEEVHKQKMWLYSEISKLPNLEIGADTKTNIYILRHRSKDLYNELLRRNILTADFRTSDGLQNLGYVRITIGDHYKNRLLINALKEID